jgi:hypothetical protein
MATTDWELIRKEYVNGKDSVRELALRFKVSENALEKRSAKGKWAEARRNMAEKVVAWADAKVAEVRVDQIAQFNTDDLRMARAIRAKAAALLSAAGPKSAADLRALAGAVEVAQKVGRLALGMTTENTGLSSPNGGPVEIDDGARETIRQKLLR